MEPTESTLPTAPHSERPQVAEKNRKGGLNHDEQHSDHGDVIRDIIIGFADGLTRCDFNRSGCVPGSCAERAQYISEEKREQEEVQVKPEAEKEEIYEIMDGYGVPRESTRPLVEALTSDPVQWVKFMMDFELRLAKPSVSRAWISAATKGLAYFLGMFLCALYFLSISQRFPCGLIPMIPYFAIKDVTHALFISIGITIVILLLFGYIKNYFTVGTKQAGAYGAAQTLFIGILAAATSYGIVRAIDSKQPFTRYCSASQQPLFFCELIALLVQGSQL